MSLILLRLPLGLWRPVVSSVLKQRCNLSCSSWQTSSNRSSRTKVLAKCLWRLLLPPFLQGKDELILQLSLIIGRVLGQALVWDSMQQHAWSAGLARAMLDKLVELNSRFKCIVHVFRMRNEGCGHAMNGCYSGAASVDHFRHTRRNAVLTGRVDVLGIGTLKCQ